MSKPAGSRVVYQFPISHYCEKTRWNLDAKGLAYRAVDVTPGVHLLALRRFTRKTTVPLLVDGTVVIGNSEAIAQHLDRSYPDRPLLPIAAADRARVRELERWFGMKAGRAVRVWMYGQLGARPGGMVARLFADYSPRMQRLASAVAPMLERGIRKKYRIDAAGIERARATIEECFARIESETNGDPSRYLVGDALSIADITAAALLAPLVAPAGSNWASDAEPPVPASITAFREQLAGSPGWRWVEARYARDRAPARLGATSA